MERESGEGRGGMEMGSGERGIRGVDRERHGGVGGDGGAGDGEEGGVGGGGVEGGGAEVVEGVT